MPASNALSPARARGLVRAGSPSTRPVASGNRASLDPDAACRLLQPYTTHGHTREHSILARAATCARELALVALHSRGRNKSRAGAIRGKARRQPSERFGAYAPHPAPGARVTVSNLGEVWITSRRLATAKTHRRCFASRKARAPRGSGHLLPRRNSYATGRSLLRARPNRGLVTPPPQRHCSEARTPLCPPR